MGGSCCGLRSSSRAHDPEPLATTAAAEDPEVARRRKFCDAARAYLPSKGSATIIGWMLKKGLVLSLTGLVLQQGATLTPESTGDTAVPKQSEGLTTVLLHLLAFLLLLIIAAVASMRIGASQMHLRAKAAYTAGLALIPGWAWKDAVSTFITFATKRRLMQDEGLGKAPPLFNAALALLVTLTAAVVQILADWCLANASETGLAHHVLQMLRGSLALGVGFAFNNIFKSFFSSVWSQVWFQLVYLAAIALVIPVLQVFLKKEALNESSRKAPEDRYVLLDRMAAFTIKAGDFIIGWAFKGLLDALLAPLMHDTVWKQLIATLIVTLVCSAIVVIVTFVPVPDTVQNLGSLVSGMCAGWSWSDFAAALYGDKNLGFLLLWLYIFSVILVVALVAYLLELLIRRMEPAPPQE